MAYDLDRCGVNQVEERRTGGDVHPGRRGPGDNDATDPRADHKQARRPDSIGGSRRVEVSLLRFGRPDRSGRLRF